MSDPETKFSKSIGWTMGERTGRYAMVIDHGKITYAEKETSGGEVSVGDVVQPFPFTMLIWRDRSLEQPLYLQSSERDP